MGVKNGLVLFKRMLKVYLFVLKRWKCLVLNKYLVVVIFFSYYGVFKLVEKNKIKYFLDNVCNCLYY